MKKFNLVFLLIPLLVLLNGCDCEDYDTEDVTVRLELFKSDLGNYKSYNLSIRPIDSKSLVTDTRSMANTVVSLPVDLNKKTQTYVINSDGVYDTLTIGYRRHSEFQESCGFRFWVDSLYIARPSTMKESKVIKYYGNESISVTY